MRTIHGAVELAPNRRAPKVFSEISCQIHRPFCGSGGASALYLDHGISLLTRTRGEVIRDI